MTLIKKIDVERHFAARRAMRLGRIRPLSQPGAARNAPAAAAKDTAAFREDFTQEHSSPEVSAAPIPITPVSGENRLLRPPESRQR